MERKCFKFNVKDVGEHGEFKGYASVFGNVDLQSDVVERGAFKRTIDHNAGKVPILAFHDSSMEIGMTKALIEDQHGLAFQGQLYLDDTDPKNELPDARAMYVRMKRRLEFDKPMGVSFGYDVIKHAMDGTVRRLKELKLWEISIVPFAANPSAMVLDVKEQGKQRLPTSVQSLILLKSKFENLDDAKKWITDHDFHASKVDETDGSWRFRQFEPSDCAEESFRTIEMAEGVSAAICRKKGMDLTKITLLDHLLLEHSAKSDCASSDGQEPGDGGSELIRSLKAMNEEIRTLTGGL